jgi:hypothetical protein
MPRKHTIFDIASGQQVDIPFTASEEAARDAEEAAEVVKQQEATLAKTQRQSLRDSTHQKLRDLGLTDDEISTLSV